jgi:hypothetical protein
MNYTHGRNPMRRTMQRNIIVASALLLAACAAGDRPQEEELEPVTTAAAAISPADVAGIWDVEVTNVAGDSVLTTYTLHATDSWNGWMMRFHDGQSVDLRIMETGGDSLIVEAGPYPSVLRPGVQVSTRTVMRVDGQQMHGSGKATYQLEGGASELPLRYTGSRQ